MYKFLDNEQFNFQINRIVAYGSKYADVDEIKTITPNIKDMESWINEFLSLAHRTEEKGAYTRAFSYYRMAEFYMLAGTSEKEKCYKKCMDCFEKAHEGENLDRYEIPFENTFLPAYKIKAENEKGIILVCGGYDSFIEEFYPILEILSKYDYTVIAFEGPGQGRARKNNLAFRYDWEVPTSAVIDYFDLNNITLIGVSWGGYLSLRASAFDRRIKNVICYDIFYRGLDLVGNRMNEDVFRKLETLLKLHQSFIVNKIITNNMKGNIDLTWKMQQGMYITGTKSPYDFLKSIEKHDISSVIKNVTQNVLLLAGENDQYVPIRRLEQIKNELVNAKSITSRRFTKEENADDHCQIGNVSLVMDEVLSFLNKYSL